MIHPAYELLLDNGIDPEYITTSVVVMSNLIVSNINSSGERGIIAYSEWGTVRAFFDGKHVCNIVCDDRGVSFEFDRRGVMRTDSRANRIVYSVIQAVAYQPK